MVVARILEAKGGGSQVESEGGAVVLVLCSTSFVSRWTRLEGRAQNLKRAAVVCLSGMRAMRRRIWRSKVVAAMVRKLMTKMVEPRGMLRKRVPSVTVVVELGPLSPARASCRWWSWVGEKWVWEGCAVVVVRI